MRHWAGDTLANLGGDNNAMTTLSDVIQDVKAGHPGLNHSDLVNMIGYEFKDILRFRFNRKPQTASPVMVSIAYLEAEGRIKMWLETSASYSVDGSDLANMASFVASHGTACVWAVLCGKAGL